MHDLYITNSINLTFPTFQALKSSILILVFSLSLYSFNYAINQTHIKAYYLYQLTVLLILFHVCQTYQICILSQNVFDTR